MSSRHRIKSSSGFRGVRLRPSGCWTVEITEASQRWYMGTFDTADLAARAYDVSVMWLNRPRVDLYFSEESRENAEFIVGALRMLTRDEVMQDHRAYMQLRIRRDDEAAMARFRRDHPELVQAQMDLDAERDAIVKKQAASSSRPVKAGPSDIINMLSDSDDSFEAYWESFGLSDDSGDE